MNTRRQVITAAAAALIPATAVRAAAYGTSLTDITTLQKLAAELKFASADMYLPTDWTRLHVEFDGAPLDNVKEVYAPEDESGRAVVMVRDSDGVWRGASKLIRGRMKIIRDESENAFSRSGV